MPSSGQAAFALCDEYLKEYSEIDGISRSKAEALYLILSHNLLLLLQKECGADDLVEKKRLDIGKIAISFRKPKASDQTDLFDKLVSLRQPFADWYEMDELILEATKNSTPLLAGSDINSGGIDIEEYLAGEGERIEKEAFLEYTGQKGASGGAKKYPLCELFQKIKIESNTKADDKEKSISDTVGNFLRFTDTGAAAVSAKKISKRINFFSCVYRAGEQSRFIHPKQYSIYIPVLIFMERDCNNNQDEIKKRIHRLFQEENDLASKLTEFTDMLYSSGQRLSDWNINLLSHLGTLEEVPDGIDDRGREFLLISRTISNTGKQLKYINRYNEVYPE